MKRGFSLIELIIYIAILAAILGVFTSMVLIVNRSYSSIAVVRNMDTAAITSMERITRSIRASSSVDSANSVLGSTPGKLSLSQVDQGGVSSNTTFQISNQNIQILVSGVSQGTLLQSGVTVSRLIFTLINSGKSQAVKVEMQLTGKIGASSLVSTYYSTVILRGSYQ